MDRIATSDKFRLNIFERQNLAKLADKISDNRNNGIAAIYQTYGSMLKDIEQRIKDSNKETD